LTSPRRLLSERGLAAQKGRGQNFLADPRIAVTIARHGHNLPAGVLLEIGPGLGALTEPLLSMGRTVVAVEVDLGLAARLKDELLPRYPNTLHMIENDVLKVDLASMAAEFGGRLGIIGNLPYQISTPLLVKLIQARAVLSGAVLMFQKELAQRLTAAPGNKSYGRLSVLVDYFCRVEKVMDLGPDVFYPKPKVGSTVVRLILKENPEPRLESEKLFTRVVAAGFSRRRKTLSNALRSDFTAERITAALQVTGIDPSRRAETLNTEEFVRLANFMFQNGV
jgi:16S rRNA (adenine1518-N6/adenine1519-N6)-dimethyltransferase